MRHGTHGLGECARPRVWERRRPRRPDGGRCVANLRERCVVSCRVVVCGRFPAHRFTHTTRDCAGGGAGVPRGVTPPEGLRTRQETVPAAAPAFPEGTGQFPWVCANESRQMTYWRGSVTAVLRRRAEADDNTQSSGDAQCPAVTGLCSVCRMAAVRCTSSRIYRS